MDIEHEIQSLSAETIAIQTALVHILSLLSRIDERFYSEIKRGFDNAASDAEDMAIKFGKAASPDHLVKAIAIIETLRTATLGNPDKPKSLV